jgi:Rps23 Pro-64 3,4-dihydroxylase Tpa1-like proline 4-hydroxylase
MNESHKIQLFKEGYTTFNLYELNDSEINQSLNELQTLSKKEFKNLRYKTINNTNDGVFIKDSFENLEEIKNSIKKTNLYEMWYYNDVIPKNKYNKQLLNKIKQFFYNEDVNDFNHATYITMYNDGCVLIEHNDGFNPNSKYKCVILIYLNDESEIQTGGELILDGNILIKPVIGNVAIMDFTKNDIKHGVKEVSGYHRKCYLNFC